MAVIDVREEIWIKPKARLKKSHSGCRECKARKVKCDEIRPVCTNCRRRYDGLESCEWNHEFRPSKRRKTIKPEAPASKVEKRSVPALICRIAPQPTMVSDDISQRCIELRLMHHYTSVVGPSMPDCETDVALQMWQQRIPQLAFGSEVVLNPMLAISALHLHAHSQHDPGMARTLRRYLDRALQHHRQAVISSDTELTEPAWLSAVILSNINWLLARYRESDTDDEYELPLQMWKMFHGVGMLFTQQRAVLDRMGYGWYGEKLKPLITPKDQLSSAARAQLRLVEEDLQFLCDAFDVKGLPREESDVYLEAKDYIIDQYRAFYSGTSARVLRWYIGTMVSRCNARFCENLEAHDPLAMALLARMLVLMHALEEVWWMNGVGQYRVLEHNIPGIEMLMPKSLKWTMRWPFSILNGETKLRR